MPLAKLRLVIALTQLLMTMKTLKSKPYESNLIKQTMNCRISALRQNEPNYVMKACSETETPKSNKNKRNRKTSKKTANSSLKNNSPSPQNFSLFKMITQITRQTPNT